jgi:hypothetical protein
MEESPEKTGINELGPNASINGKAKGLRSN